MLNGIRTYVALAIAAALLIGHVGPSVAAAGAQITIDVPHGMTRSVRLRDLPRGTLVSVTLEASGRLDVVLIGAEQLKLERPVALYSGTVERRLSFQVILRESNDYYLLLDNRRGAKRVKTHATISAEKGAFEPEDPQQHEKRPAGKFEQTRAAPVFVALPHLC